MVLTFVVTSTAFVVLPKAVDHFAGPELNAETAAQACLAKGRDLARSVEENSGVGSYGTTVTSDDVTVGSVTLSGDTYVTTITLHQLARNAYGSLRGSKLVGCAAYYSDATDKIEVMVAPGS